MKSKIYSTLAFLLLTIFSIAQTPPKTPPKVAPKAASEQKTVTIIARVLDGTSLSPLVGAVAVIDSSSLHGVADSKGEIEIKNVPRGQVELRITYMGYREYKKSIDTKLNTSVINLGIIKLNESVDQIEEVRVDGQAPPVVVKGDTTQFNASGYKVNGDAMTEDLVKKLPGVKVNEDGTVEAQGEAVKKVYVDGKQLFGKDPATTLKNLPANMVQSIQMFDELDDKSKFSGYNSGTTERALNVVTNKGLTSAGFGSADVGFGVDQDKIGRYIVGANAGLFRDKESFMANVNTNNINQSRFGMRGGGMFGGGYGGSRGMQRKTTASITYATEKLKNLKLDMNYMFDNTASSSATELARKYFQTEKVNRRDYGTISENSGRDYNHTASFGIEYNVTPKDQLLLRAHGSFQHDNSRSYQSAFNNQYDALGEKFDTINKNFSNNNTLTNGYNTSVNLLYTHAFDKAGRSLTISADANFSGNNSDTDQEGKTFINKNDPDNIGLPPIWDTISNDQYVHNVTPSQSLEASVIYSEPVGKYSRILANYTLLFDNSMSDRRSYANRQMDVIYDSISNTFKNSVMRNRAGVGYNYDDGINDLSFGFDIEHNYQEKLRTYPIIENFADRAFMSWAPNVSYRFKIEKRRYINVTYNGSTQVPSVEQMRGVVDNTNTLMLTAGNPDLKQAYRHNMRIRYNSVNSEKSTNFFVAINLDNTINAIMNNSFTIARDTTIYGYDIKVAEARGVRFSQPVNMNGNWGLRSMTGYSFTIKPLKCNLNLDASYAINRRPSYYEQVLNQSTSHQFSLGIGVVSNISENVDFDIKSNTTYSFADNTSKNNTRYFSENVSARINVVFLKSFVFASNVSYRFYRDNSRAGLVDQYTAWNASIAKKFLKGNRGEISISVNDILNQNLNYRVSINDTYSEETRTNMLGRYIMATFTYRFSSMDKYKGEGPKGGGGRGHRGMGGGFRMGGMMH